MPVEYSLCELLVCESSVPKTKRQAVRGLRCPTITFPPGTSRFSSDLKDVEKTDKEMWVSNAALL